MNLKEKLEHFLNAYRNGKTSEEFKSGARFGAMWVVGYLQDALRGMPYSLKEKQATMEKGDFLASHVADTYGDEGRQEFSISILHELSHGEISVDHAVRWVLDYFSDIEAEAEEAEYELVSARDLTILGDTIDGVYRLTYNRSTGFLDVWKL